NVPLLTTFAPLLTTSRQELPLFPTVSVPEFVQTVDPPLTLTTPCAPAASPSMVLDVPMEMVFVPPRMFQAAVPLETTPMEKSPDCVMAEPCNVVNVPRYRRKIEFVKLVPLLVEKSRSATTLATCPSMKYTPLPFLPTI